jgi:hypothetical protein
VSAAGFRPYAGMTATEKAGGKPIAAFAFAPTRATLAKLLGHRLLFRARVGGFQVYNQHGPDGTIAPISAPVRLLFAMRATDPAALGRYKPADDPAAGPGFYLTNLAPDGNPQASPSLTRGDAAGAPDSVRIVGRRFQTRVPLPTENRPTSIELLRRYEGTRVGAAIPVPTGDGAAAAELSFDVSKEDGAAFTLATKPGGAQQHFFAEDEMAGAGALGIVELVLKAFPGPEPASGRDFTAVFERTRPA